MSDTTDSFIGTSMASIDALLDTEADDATGRILFYLMYLTCNKFHSSGLLFLLWWLVIQEAPDTNSVLMGTAAI